MGSNFNKDTCHADNVFTYTPDMSRPLCPICGGSVHCDTNTPTVPWRGTCVSGHSATFQLDLDDCEWLEDSKTGRFSRFATEPEQSTWVCNECGSIGADPHEYGCNECGAEADFY